MIAAPDPTSSAAAATAEPSFAPADPATAADAPPATPALPAPPVVVPESLGIQRISGSGSSQAPALRSAVRARKINWLTPPGVVPSATAICSWLAPSSSLATSAWRWFVGSAFSRRTTPRTSSRRSISSGGCGTPLMPSSSWSWLRVARSSLIAPLCTIR